MNLHKIVDNFRSFNQDAVQDWALEEILTVIFKKVVSLEYRKDISELLERSRISVYSLVDLPYGPDRSCELHVLTLDDNLVALAQREGRQEWTSQILNLENFKQAALEIATAALTNDLAELEEVNLDDALPRLGYPVQFLDKDESMFVILDPRSVYRLHEVPNRHRVYFVNATGQAQQVTEIGQFQQNNWVNGKPATDNSISVVIEGEQNIVDASQLLFELIAGQGNIEAALNVYNTPAYWKVAREARLVKRLVIDVKFPLKWNTSQTWVEFSSIYDMDAFLSKYPVGQVVSGLFEEKLLSDSGWIFKLNQ